MNNNKKIQIIAYNRNWNIPTTSSVACDHRMGGEIVAQYFNEKNHNNIGLIYNEFNEESVHLSKWPKVNKKDIIDRISRNQDQLPHRDIELAVKTIINCMTQALSTGERIELRGFGSFSLRYRKPRIGRNPKSGMAVNINERYVPHFKPGKNLKNKVNKGTD